MQQNNNLSKYLYLFKGIISGLISLISAILLSALFIYKSNLSDKFYIPLMLASVVLSGFVSGYLSVMKIRKNGLMNGAVSTVASVIVLFIAMSVANRGFNLLMIIPCLILVVSGTLGGIAAVNIKHKNKKK
jgi:putative membrane protein (TIGR04086 family)